MKSLVYLAITYRNGILKTPCSIICGGIIPKDYILIFLNHSLTAASYTGARMNEETNANIFDRFLFRKLKLG